MSKSKVESLDNMKVDQLKEILKQKKMVSSGDKGTLVFRIKLAQKCEELKLVTADGEMNPCTLSAVDLKKHASKVGVSPMGTQDEILAEYVKYLEKNAHSKSSSSASSSDSKQGGESSSTGGSGIDPIAVAEQVLEYAENDDYEAILNMTRTSNADPVITKNSPISIMRKAYLKLSLIIHPDKIGRIYSQATKAFQALVKAFDVLSCVDIDISGDSFTSKGGKKQPMFTISRSNDGCYRTRVCCPRCRQPWSEGTLDGNPPYFYNFLMQGLKSYTCSTCLCEFGCMTATHKCPHCSKPFEYSVEDYHRKVKCHNSKCQKSFGFFLFPVSDRVMKELRIEIKNEQDAKIAKREAKQRRAGRVLNKSLTSKESEKAFLLGLIDNCPRCGESFEGYPDEETQRAHLMECTDTEKHLKHKQQQADNLKKIENKQKKLSIQEDIQAQAAFTFLGAQSSQLYLLNEDQIKKHAIANKVDSSGSKDDVIARLAMKNNPDQNNLLLHSDDTGGAYKTNHSSSNGSGSGNNNSTSLVTTSKQNALVEIKKRKRIHIDSLPSNLHSLSVSQLRSVCAANGLLPLLKENSTKTEILDILDDAIFDD